MRILILVLVFLSDIALALEMGSLMIFSTGNQPFYAEMDLTNLSESERKLHAIKVQIEKDIDIYRKFNVPYNSYVADFKYEVKIIDNFQAVLVITNRQSIPLTGVAFILTVSSPINTMTKKINTERQVVPPQAYSAPPSRAAVPIVANRNVNSSELRIDILPNDNLLNISEAIYQAYYLHDTNVSIQQIMTAIRRADYYTAFEAYSYKLIVGKYVRLPTYSNITSQTKADAKREIDTYYYPTIKKTTVGGKEGSCSSCQETSEQFTLKLLTTDQKLYKQRIGLKQDQVLILEHKSKNLGRQAREYDKQIQDLSTIISLKQRELYNLKAGLRQDMKSSFLGYFYALWLDIHIFIRGNPIVAALSGILVVLLLLVWRRWDTGGLSYKRSIKRQPQAFQQPSQSPMQFAYPMYQPSYQSMPAEVGEPNKLSVARALLAIGNLDDAKRLLKQIISQGGNPGVVAEANALLAQL